MLKAVGRMGVQVVYDYPFFKKYPVVDSFDPAATYEKIGEEWNKRWTYRDEEA